MMMTSKGRKSARPDITALWDSAPVRGGKKELNFRIKQPKAQYQIRPHRKVDTCPMNQDLASDADGIRPSRLRVKKACVPCVQRKRRCNGEDPCATCVRYEYICQYDGISRRKRRRQKSLHNPTKELDPHVQSDPPKEVDEGNALQGSSTANEKVREDFTPNEELLKVLSQRTGAPNFREQRLPAWNLGIDVERAELQPRITNIIPLYEMKVLAKTYFEVIHPAFAFLNRDVVDKKLAFRWLNRNEDDYQDPILCGIATIGSLFSADCRSNREAALMNCAKTLLESDRALMVPSYEQVGAWILRTMYLRGTARPHAGWMASCTTVHLIEALEMEAENGHQPESEATLDPHALLVKDKMIWIARLFNDWISNEYGRSKVEVKVKMPPLPGPHDSTFEMLRLHEISRILSADETQPTSTFEDSITRVAASNFDFDGLALSQTILGFALYRRLRMNASACSRTTTDSIMNLGERGLGAARRMVSRRQPWWHVANVPFQFIYVLLVMDTQESLAKIGDAMRTLREVAECFPTQATSNSVTAAKRLIKVSQDRKVADVVLLDHGLDTDEDPSRQNPDSTLPIQPLTDILASLPPQQMTPQRGNMRGLNQVDFDQLDWSYFLRNMDVPVCGAFDFLGDTQPEQMPGNRLTKFRSL
ncbi:hypothetical protein G7Y89_g14153 [Cudoniella acicularis]|uniref:Zn(2)-C6 fungal-type domain-containing protein n=1 Tax=Cudoniella acicularis TaxID=354080 RepID=A0A8H4R862_9HELO|nr:hypothetical protein G7Y89_g14153 [Cudoniella acicularis]